MTIRIFIIMAIVALAHEKLVAKTDFPSEFMESSVMADSTYTNEQVFFTPERQPQFPGGLTALMQWLSDHMEYPVEAARNGIEGRVIVKFKVSKIGEVGEVSVMKSCDELLSEEAIRVVNTLPNFIPGTINGMPVNVWYLLPITFLLPK